MSCGICGERGHNARTCVNPGWVAVDPENHKPVKRCGRCQKIGHTANRCQWHGNPVKLTSDGRMTHAPGDMVIVLTKMLSKGRYGVGAGRVVRMDPQVVFDMLVYGDGSARVYRRDDVDWRVTAGLEGGIPYADTAEALRQHFVRVGKGTLAPIQVSVTLAQQMFPDTALAIPVWDDDDDDDDN